MNLKAQCPLRPFTVKYFDIIECLSLLIYRQSVMSIRFLCPA